MLVNSERTVISERWGFEGAWPEHILALRDPSPEQIQAARITLADYEQLCRPMAEADLVMELSRLREVLKASREREGEFGLNLDTMMDELSAHPADLVLWAIRFWRRCEKFYPTPSELHALIQRRLCGRNAIMDALRRLIKFGEENQTL